jgi:hypothetical protein
MPLGFGLYQGSPVATAASTSLYTLLGWYDVRRYGLVAGSTSANAAANTAALQTLWTTISSTSGGGVIYFPQGEWPLNATTLDHQAGSSKSISLRGATGGSSLLKLYGTTGPFLDISPSSSSPLFQCGISDLRILHNGTVTSGATIRLGYTSRYNIDRVLMDANGAFHAIELIAGASVHAHDSTFTCRDVANAVCVEFLQTVASGGVQFTNCDLSGGGFSNSRGLRFNNTALVDTIVANNTSIKDHAIGIASASNTGDIQNFQMNGGFLDGCATCISIQPTTGADYGSFEFNGVWMSATTQIAVLATGNGGTVTGFMFTGASWHNATQGGITIQDGVSTVKLTGINMDLSNTNNASYSGIVLDNTVAAGIPNRITITGCTVVVGASTAACINVAALADPICIVGNDLIGGADADGIIPGAATSTSRVIANNSYTP